MDVSVGIGRPIMKDEPGLTFRGFPDLIVESYRLPFLKNLWFSLREAGLHGKSGLGKV
jgi:hypothetical protein